MCGRSIRSDERVTFSGSTFAETAGECVLEGGAVDELHVGADLWPPKRGSRGGLKFMSASVYLFPRGYFLPSPVMSERQGAQAKEKNRKPIAADAQGRGRGGDRVVYAQVGPCEM